MTAPTFFTVIADYKSVVVDVASDVDANPQLGPITAKVTFTPMLANGDVLLATNASPRPTGYVAAPIVARIDTDGRLKLRVDPDGDIDIFANTAAFPATGLTAKVYFSIANQTYYRWTGSAYAETYPYAAVRLLADTALLKLDSPLYYRVTFSEVVFNGASGYIAPFVFEAPSTDTELNLIEVTPVPGTPASGQTKVAPGAVRLEDGDVVFSFAGVDIPDPFPFEPSFDVAEISDSGVIGRELVQAETAASARSTIGATTTGSSLLIAASATAARTAISAVGTRSKVHNDPRGRPDGLINDGDALDAGSVLNVSGVSKIKYVSGRLAHDAAAVSGTPTAGYLQVQTDSAVRTMRAEVAWPLNAIGAVAYVIPSPVAVWDYDAGGGTLPAAGVHLTAYGNGIWNIAVWNPAPGSVGHVDHSVQPGTATSFTLTVTTTTPSSTQTTASISTGATAVSVKSAIEALTNVGVGDVTVTKSTSGNYGLTWATGLGAVTMTATGSGGTMGMAAPLLLNTGNTISAVVAYSTGLTIYGNNTSVGRYATVWDNSLRYLELFVFPDTDQVLLVFPDGTNSGLMKHPGIGLFTSNRAVFELFENNSSAVDTPATMGAFAVDDQPTFIDSPVIDKSVLLTTVAQSRPVTLYDGGNTTAADITASGAIPVGTTYIELVLIGGGGGGGAGGCQPSGTAVNGGSGGGSAGVIREIIPVSALGTTWNITVGRAGLGGASISSTGTGTAGAAGLLSRFISGSAVFQALGAGGGPGGTSGGTASAAAGAGGPFATAGSPSGINGAAGLNGVGMVATLGNPGSASGGGVTTVPTATNGGIGGSNLVRGYTGGTAGVVGGAAPGRGTDSTATAITSTPAGTPGPGAGGGAGSASGAAQAGANAAGWGGGGGGGGASLNGSASGKGGDGRGGYVLVKAHLL